VNGAVTVHVGGLQAFNSLKGIAVSVKGSSRETVGAARVELIRGGKAETTATSKLETVGVYMVNAKQSYTVTAKAAVAVNVAGSQRQNIKGGHTMGADGPVLLSGPKLKLTASGTITLACGACKVIINSSGISIEGASELTVDGSKVKLNENALGSV
jgi:type VI secretion system secreted protein VgrG